MNLPNKLTIGRIILVPFFVALMLIDFPLNHLVALLVFIIAALTDLFDGKIARKRNLVTNFGKFADPLADKILVLSAFLCFVQNGYCDCVAVIIVLFREFAVISIRLIAATNGKVIAANIWGKVKTVTQMIAIIAVIVLRTVLELPEIGIDFNPEIYTTLSPVLWIAGEVLIWISTFFAIVSGIIYIYQNREFISET